MSGRFIGFALDGSHIGEVVRDTFSSNFAQERALPQLQPVSLVKLVEHEPRRGKSSYRIDQNQNIECCVERFRDAFMGLAVPVRD